MPLISLLILIAVIGVVVWLITTYIPMPQPFKSAILVVAIVAVLLVILNAFGLLDSLYTVRVGSPAHR